MPTLKFFNPYTNQWEKFPTVKGDKGDKGEPGIQGPQGDKGDDGAGVNILGSYDSYNDLVIAHPTGNIGDAYMVNGVLYVWSVTSNSWLDMGNIKGPKGDQGPQGEKGDPGKDADPYDDSALRQLINDNLQAAKDYTDNEIANFDFIKVVESLPDTGLPNRVYFVPKTESTTEDIFEEYAWINGSWEYFGTKVVKIDLTDINNSITALQNNKADRTDLPVNISELINDIGYLTSNITGDIQLSGKIYLGTVGSSVNANTSSRIVFGTPNQAYSFLSSNTSGAFSFSKGSGNITIYPNTSQYNCIMSDCNSDLGRSDKLWKDLYLSGKLSNGTKTITVANLASLSDIPKKVSALTNDAGYITSEDIPTKTSELDNDSGFITEEDIPEADGILTGSIIGYNSTVVPEGYEEVELTEFIPLATPETEGLMSAEDKTKLDNLGNIEIDPTIIYEALYPIGRGFIDFTNTDYSNYLGFTWERELIGMFPVGYNPDDTTFSLIGNTGGSKTISGTVGGTAITKAQLPSYTLYDQYHSHNIPVHVSSNGSASGISSEDASKSSGVAYYIASETARITVSSGGSGQTHTHGFTGGSNLPPYQVVAYWKRVA